MEEILDVFVGQWRNADPSATVELAEVYEDEAASVVVIRSRRARTYLLVRAANVAVGHGKWFLSWPGLIEKADVVCVFYGYASTKGAYVVDVADRGGNPYQDDYRRIIYADDVRRAGHHRSVFAELGCLMTEENLRRSFTGDPFVVTTRREECSSSK